ncbi:CopG family ribbon-helix-helix protein [Devosia sp. SL43]|uniref:CopG family ribbon-helix-helix protein n=1 Tax=Devosia sp. SL43 TaxID=2806348 RepID=UPI001F01CA6E|nr:ribbon-helix-helix protein, CopG family [Devosia sp. SL43]UJW84473.1 ribbon-helix-helix protein, CopG family [Devosia sp. SL43]
MSKPVLSDPVPVRLPVELLGELERIAVASDRTRSWVIVRALKLYLAGEGAEVLAVLHGREQVAAGEVHDFDAVLDEVDAIIRGKVA